MKKSHPPRKFRWRWWYLYVLLLFASWLVQAAVHPGGPTWPTPPNQLTLTVPRMTSDGPAGGPPVTLSYRTYGPDNAPITLIAIHGSPHPAPGFTHLADHLKQNIRLLAVDLPGYALSSKWVPDYGIKAQAHYILAAMDALHIDKAHVLGFSLGSGTALWMSQLAPQRVQSLILFGGIGIQEGEGSGDYYFEHLKYRVGYALLVVGFEFVPHFGYLGSRSFRHAFIRNFIDTDQRPLRGILEKLTQPLLILHGRDDPLVPARTAWQHHQIVKHSELVMFDGSHFMLFRDDSARRLAAYIQPFVEKYNHENHPAPQRATIDFTADRIDHPPTLPLDLDLNRGNAWSRIAGIMLATYILEDPATITVGLLIKDHQLDLFLGIFAIFLGIFTGDLGLYLIGRYVGRPALRWNLVARRLPVHRVDQLGAWFDRHGWTAVLASRFIPGSRFPLYVAAGAMGKKPWRFFIWTMMAVAIWAPVMILLVIFIGEAASSPIRMIFGSGWPAVIAAVILLVLLLRGMVLLCTTIGRGRLKAFWSRFHRHEFWPAWAFYPPLFPYLVYLSIRHRSCTVWTLANPAIPLGGWVGESKRQILTDLDSAHTLPWVFVPENTSPQDRTDAALRSLTETGIDFPVIAKPDASQRGVSLRLVRDRDQLESYLTEQPAAVMLQTYHPGPGEAGIFYYRRPGETVGHIYSITDKVFPVITGDGRHTLETLIWRHPRYRMQANIFLRRFESQRDRVLDIDETMSLGVAGNHCQGTLFRDGAHLITPALTAKINEIAGKYQGFYIGRFDVRYRDLEAFKAGRNLAIIELNGVSSESTNLYDPTWSLFRAYRTLFGQWKLLYEIGHANRAVVGPPPGMIQLVKTTWQYYRQRQAALPAD